jgi:hypothetical protein
MELNKEIEKIKEQFTAEWNKYSENGFNNQIMYNSFVTDKLAEFEYRLRKLEEGNKRADGYLNLHTPLI